MRKEYSRSLRNLRLALLFEACYDNCVIRTLRTNYRVIRKLRLAFWPSSPRAHGAAAAHTKREFP
jgi:hypothetical protein